MEKTQVRRERRIAFGSLKWIQARAEKQEAKAQSDNNALIMMVMAVFLLCPALWNLLYSKSGGISRREAGRNQAFVLHLRKNGFSLKGLKQSHFCGIIFDCK